MPIWILPSGHRVHIKDSVYLMLRTLRYNSSALPIGCEEGTYQFYYSIKVFESAVLQNPRVHIILKMPVIEWYAYAIEPQTCKELCVLFHEKIFEEFVEKELLFLLSQDLQHSCSMLAFVSGVSSTVHA